LEKEMYLPINVSLDEILSQFALSGTPPGSGLPMKVLFWGEGAGEISSYASGWMAGRGIDIIVLDGANRFNPYTVSTFARRVWISPETLLKRIRIARAFTCYQMATLIGERLALLLDAKQQRSFVILLGPITPFLDEDISEREVRPLFERILRKMNGLATEGISFFLFQSPIFSGSPFAKGGLNRSAHSRRSYLLKRLFQFSDLIWRISPDGQGAKLILERGVGELAIAESSTHIRDEHIGTMDFPIQEAVKELPQRFHGHGKALQTLEYEDGSNSSSF